MTTPFPHMLRWDARQGHLQIDEALLQPLAWPQLLKLERSADGLILTASSRQVATEGQIVCCVTYDDEQTDLPYLTLTAEQAKTLSLQERGYNAWAATWDECIYAIPRTPPPPMPSDLVAVTLLLLPREVQLLEQLALQYQVRMSEILTAFAADLAALHAVGDERYELRSGGNNERMQADAWFQCNITRNGWDDGPSAERWSFLSRFTTYTTPKEPQP